MADIVDVHTRSRMMSRVKNKNTRIEIEIRKGLWSKGIRYRLHGNKILGKPDLVLASYNALIFVHGCFWHGHDCPLFQIPKTRSKFWTDKIDGNKRRDKLVKDGLSSSPWRTMVVWECALRGKSKTDLDKVIEYLIKWLVCSCRSGEIRGD